MVTDVQTLRDRAYPPHTNDAFGVLIEITHPSLPEPVRLTNLEVDVDEDRQIHTLTAQGHEWIAAAIDVTPPGQSEDEPQGSMTTPNSDRRIGRALKTLRTAAKVTITPVLTSNPEVSLAEPYRNLELRNVETNVMEVSGDLIVTQLETEPFCQETVNESRFPAVFRAAV